MTERTAYEVRRALDGYLKFIEMADALPREIYDFWKSEKARGPAWNNLEEFLYFKSVITGDTEQILQYHTCSDGDDDYKNRWVYYPVSYLYEDWRPKEREKIRASIEQEEVRDIAWVKKRITEARYALAGLEKQLAVLEGK